MSGRSHRSAFTPLFATALAVLVLGGATLSWATNVEAEPFGQRFGPVEPNTPTDDPHQSAGGADDPSGTPTDSGPRRSALDSAGTAVPEVDATSVPSIAIAATPTSTGSAAGAPAAASPGVTAPTGGPAATGDRGASVAVAAGAGGCRTGADLVPTCGVLFGVAAGVSSGHSGARALHDFEEKTGRHQDIHRAYHRGTTTLFPTEEEIAVAREPGRRRLLFLSWKPTGTSWAKIAKGDRKVDAFLDRLAGHLRENYREDFFFTVHHSASDEVRAARGSGYTAADYAAMYRHVVRRLRAHGADNLVTVLVHAADPAPADSATLDRMYPGDDVVDWIGLDAEARTDAKAAHRDLAGLLGGRAAGYAWAAARHPGKPLMISEWSLWSSPRDPERRAAAYAEIGRQISRFPRIRAMVYVDTPQRRDGLDSRVDATPAVLRAYRRLGALPAFQVDLKRGGS